jgi:hypothetical protein
LGVAIGKRQAGCDWRLVFASSQEDTAGKSCAAGFWVGWYVKRILDSASDILTWREGNCTWNFWSLMRRFGGIVDVGDDSPFARPLPSTSRQTQGRRAQAREADSPAGK